MVTHPVLAIAAGLIGSALIGLGVSVDGIQALFFTTGTGLLVWAAKTTHSWWVLRPFVRRLDESLLALRCVVDTVGFDVFGAVAFELIRAAELRHPGRSYLLTPHQAQRFVAALNDSDAVRGALLAVSDALNDINHRPDISPKLREAVSRFADIVRRLRRGPLRPRESCALWLRFDRLHS